MALKHDPEWLRLAAPVMQMRAGAPTIPVGDALARRTMVSDVFGPLIAKLPDVPDVETEKFMIKSFDGAEIELYRYHKKGATPGPAILHTHGGGMIAGTTVLFAKAAKAYVSATGIQMFDVEYRLAPEHQDPVLVEDCYAGLTWLHENADKFGVDRARIATMGESAGGGLAAGVTLLARDRNLQPPLAKQILIYPMLDSRNVNSENKALAPFLIWNYDSNITGWGALLGDRVGTDKVSPYASPAHAKDVSGLPSTYIDTGDLDLFRDEDLTYATRLAAANVPIEVHIYPGVPHAFEVIAPTAAVVQRAAANRINAILSI